ncbi:DUF3617 family protein [Devosia sp. 63-57]|uniref:DUF3617 domain-containing protein n=1 Tax=Devosia sp. 63-57 TaxID=1895751 RepID=UPI00086BE258|nr:DUF3617 family protein [Devosia sp. 63-57]ODT50600.1 MAG: hypothetical protein ABS74_03570 [Pelagibacterium sp. SCN 63-126]ODU83476.1 MAG: hypothetical protein ABT14_15805 [Pelagibacterium sp. SCN 63-17]OJX45451.1 MAG: hypothetical protein BGO80_06480 [Devosia sp. 63-57]
MINRKILVLTLTACVSSAQAENRLEPGLWRAQTSMNGQALSEPAETCISEEGAKTSNGTDDEVKQAIVDETTRNGCAASEITIDGARIIFTTSCQGISSVTDITYEGTHYSGTLTTQLPTGSTTLDVAGDWVGACNAE